jgi:hypothetical protein
MARPPVDAGDSGFAARLPDRPYDPLRATPAPAPCVNCGAPALGRFCPACGQFTGGYDRPLGTLFAEAVDASIGVDGRLRRTLPALFLRPGALTRDFWAGRRTSQSSPLRLYLAASLICFLLFTLGEVGLLVPEIGDRDSVEGTAAATVIINEERVASFKMLGRIPEPEQAEAEASSQAPQAASAEISAPDTGALKSRASDTGAPETGAPDAAGPLDPVELYDLSAVAAQEPRRFVGTVNDYLATAMILMVGAMALIFWALFGRSRRYLFDHLVFALHFQAFNLLFLAAVGAVAHVVPPKASGGLFIVYFLTQAGYLLLAMKRAYGEGWGTTVGKFAAFSLLNMIVAIAGFAAATALALDAVT